MAEKAYIERPELCLGWIIQNGRTERHRIRARNLLVELNIGLVLGLLGKFSGQSDPDELRSEGLMSLIRSANTWDWRRGHRFSTYAVNSIKRAFYRVINPERIRPHVINHDEESHPTQVMCPTIFDQTCDPADLSSMKLAMLLLDSRQLSVIRLRFGMGRIPPQTYDSIAARLHCCREHARNIERSAIAIMREFMGINRPGIEKVRKKRAS